VDVSRHFNHISKDAATWKCGYRNDLKVVKIHGKDGGIPARVIIAAIKKTAINKKYYMNHAASKWLRPLCTKPVRPHNKICFKLKKSHAIGANLADSGVTHLI